MSRKIFTIHHSPSTRHFPFSIYYSQKLLANGKNMENGKRINENGSNGFTIIELLVATTIFSIVLIVIVASFLQVGRMFYKGVSVNNTNEAARTLVDDIANDIRLSKSSLYADPTADKNLMNVQYFCVGQHRYTFIFKTKVQGSDITATNLQAKNIQAGVIQDNTGGNCHQPSDDPPGTNATQILGPDMQLNNLTLTKSSSETGVSGVRIHTHIVFYGADNTVFDTSDTTMKNTASDPGKAAGASDAFCSGNSLSTQFCAVSDIDTNITLGF